MSELILVRHGQASFGAANYDQLSPLGVAQGAALGQYWAKQGATFAAVYVGPLRRQEQTLTAVSQHHPLPAPICLPELAEHQAMEAFQHTLPQLARRPDELGEMAGQLAGMEGGGNGRLRLKAFVHFCRLWAQGELDSGPFEPWATFRQRVQQGMDTMLAQAGGQQQMVAFTSGGVIAAAVGYALGVDDGRTMQLNAAVYNGSLTTFRFSRRSEGVHFSLVQFNAIPHLPPALQTYI
jgi:broad specificity phosphatase PhoE